MWFSPGMVVAAVAVCIVYGMTGSVNHWWVWVGAILLTLIIDAFFGIEEKTQLALPRKKIYVKKK